MKWLKKIWKMLDVKRNFIIYAGSVDYDPKTINKAFDSSLY